jgi:hypothetical protein
MFSDGRRTNQLFDCERMRTMNPLKLVRKSQHAHILVCRTCGDGFVSAGNPSPVCKSADVKKRLEDELLGGQGWQVRVVETGCLDVCPVGAITVRLVGAENSDHKVLTWTHDPDTDPAALLTELKKYLVRG